ncbi:MAG: YkgJ family cysteine cluster protein [Planctomycetes bacterium]|nr:YkgJ family cysteine cluster protein [Planctomycetota bacterium]
MNTITTVLGGSGVNDSSHLDKEEIIDRDVVIAETPIHFHIVIANECLRLSDIVPLARTTCDTLLNSVICRLIKNERHIPCHKGCAACCSYLVPLSTPEVFRMQDEFSLMPADDRIPLLESCIHTAHQILNRNRMEFETNESSGLKEISEWYAGLQIKCPFLSNGICLIYEHRPLACREHFVTSSSDHCKSESTYNPQVVRLPISIAEVLGEFSAKLEQSETEAVMLPLAFIGTDAVIERSKQTWDTVAMVNLFLDVLEQTAVKNSEMLTEAL